MCPCTGRFSRKQRGLDLPTVGRRGFGVDWRDRHGVALFVRLDDELRLFLEMQPGRFQASNTAREFLDCTDGGGRRESAAVSEYMSDGPVDAPVTVPEITNKILGQLAAGELAPAQRTAQEALAKGASTDGLDETAKKRWEMTR